MYFSQPLQPLSGFNTLSMNESVFFLWLSHPNRTDFTMPQTFYIKDLRLFLSSEKMIYNLPKFEIVLYGFSEDSRVRF